MNNNSIKSIHEPKFHCKKCGKAIEIVDFSLYKREKIKPDGEVLHKKWWTKHKKCWMKTDINKILTDFEPKNKEEFNKECDRMLNALINTPPLRYKDLKARLKKEREEKRKRAEQ